MIFMINAIKTNAKESTLNGETFIEKQWGTF